MTLSADLIHRPFRLMKIGGIDSVTGLFGTDAIADELNEILVGATTTQKGAGVPFHR